MKKIGFKGQEENLPSFDKFNNNTNKRLMFLKLFNENQKCNNKFTKNDFYYCKNFNLFELFLKKIFFNLQCSYVYSKAVKIDIQKTLLIKDFLTKLEEKNDLKFNKYSIFIKSKNSFDTSVYFIKTLLDNKFSLYLDAEKTFQNFVSNKIIKQQFDREVKIYDDSIDLIYKERTLQTKIFTFWEFINSNRLDINNHIKKAINCINNTEFKQVYLVYPKSDNFNKHIKVQCSDMIIDDEYEIKLIPYSLRSILR